MRHSTQPLYIVRNKQEKGTTLAESFGRIARSTATATPVLLAPARLSANESDIASRELGNACARRALAASGFGDAALPVQAGHTPAPRGTHEVAAPVVPVGERPAALSAMPLEAPARAARARQVAQIAMTVWRAIAMHLKQRLQLARQRRQAHATYEVLRGLDARTLQDIGLHRSEVLSVALELGGASETTRVQSMRTTRGR